MSRFAKGRRVIFWEEPVVGGGETSPRLERKTCPESGVMVALQAGDVVTVPLTEAIKGIKTVPPSGQLVRTARDTGISFGSPDYASYHKPQ